MYIEAEHADRLALLDRGVLGDVEREARLPDGRTGGQDDEVARLEAGRQGIEVGERIIRTTLVMPAERICPILDDAVLVAPC